jgi:hypothetical protein
MNDTVNIETLKELSEDFGLPYVENYNSITIIGIQQLIVFNKTENDQCQLS